RRAAGQPQDSLIPPRAHLYQARGEDPDRGRPVRHAPRPDRDGRRAQGLTRRSGSYPIRAGRADPSIGSMTTTNGKNPAAVVPQFALAGAFLEGLAAQDFTELGGALAAGARLRALLPPGLMEW